MNQLLPAHCRPHLATDDLADEGTIDSLLLAVLALLHVVLPGAHLVAVTRSDRNLDADIVINACMPCGLRDDGFSEPNIAAPTLLRARSPF